MISFTLSTFNTLNYLKLAVKSVRKNSFYKDAPFIIHAENCTDGTNEWLLENQDKYNLEIYIETNETPRGIGGGMNFCASKVKTKYIGFLSSDFWMSTDWDTALVDICEQNTNKNVWAFSYRVEPDIFNDPISRPGVIKVNVDTFGEFHHNFNSNSFDEWSSELSSMNDIEYNIDINEILFGYGNTFYKKIIGTSDLGGWDTFLQLSQRYGIISFLVISFILVL